MYSITGNMEKVSNFFLDNQFKVYWKGCFLYDIQHNLLANVNGNIFQVFKKDNSILINYFSNEDGLEMLCEFEGVENLKLRKIREQKKFLKEINNNVIAELSYDSSFNTVLSVVNFDEKKLVEDIVNPFGFKLLETIFLNWDKEKLESYELDYGIKVFEYPLSQLSKSTDDEGKEKEAELISIIGVYKKVLWILITERKIIGLDVEKGILLHEIDLCNELSLAQDSIENFNFLVKDVHLDNESGIIKSLSYRYYWEMNLGTLKIEIKKDFGEKTQESWRINRSAYYSGDKNLYFIGTNKGEVVNRAVGIFDTEKLEVLWYDTPLEEKKYLFFTDVPQANNKILGVLDSENNLRIYDRD